MPNHKNAPVGPTCPMNAAGRHFRHPDDIGNPVCDYDGCSFFAKDDLATLEYPADISVGPAAGEAPAAQSSEIAEIMALLKQQKADDEIRNQNVLALQKQVNDMLQSGLLAAAAATTTPPLVITTSSPNLPQNTPTYSFPAAAPIPAATSAMPTHIASAANDYLARLGLTSAGQGVASSFTGLNNSAVMSSQHYQPGINQQFQPVTVSNPLAGMGAAIGVRNGSQVTSVDQLYNATIKCKQLRAVEFACTSQFPYKSQITQNNVNAVVFAYGSVKHLEAIASGLIPNVSHDEFLARIKHLKNVFEIASLSSNLAQFCDPAWQVAREYDSRIVADIESGAKSWEGLSNGLESDAIYVAKEVVLLKNQSKKAKDSKLDKSEVKNDKTKKDPKTNGCTTYNTHRSSEGCYWESINKGETCVYEHYCSYCKANRNSVEKHKSINCEHKSSE